MPRNKTRSVRHKKKTTHPDGAAVILKDTQYAAKQRWSNKKTPQQGCRPVSPREIGELLEMSARLHESHVCRNTTSKQTKKHMTQCWPLSSNEPRTKSANEYLRTQTRPNTNAPTAQNAVLHFHREDTNTHENKNKKTQNDQLRNINKTTNKLHVVATKRLHITCLQMKPCTTTRNRRKRASSARTNLLSSTGFGLFFSCSPHRQAATNTTQTLMFNLQQQALQF